VLRRLSVLPNAHQLRGVANSVPDPVVQELVPRIRRVYTAQGALPGRKTAVTKGPLEAMLAMCTDDLAVTVPCCSLPSRAAALGSDRRCHGESQHARRTEYGYRLARSKSDQVGTDHNVSADKPNVGPAWLEDSGCCHLPSRNDSSKCECNPEGCPDTTSTCRTV
jgi:hypothetical protein